MAVRSIDFKRLVDSLPQGITLQDEKGSILYANKMAVKMIGFQSEHQLLTTPREEILKRFSMMDEKGKFLDSERLPSATSLKKRKSLEKIIRFRSNNSKKEFWSLVRSTPIKSKTEDLDTILNTFYDVTSSKTKEFALTVQNEMMRSLTNTMSYTTRTNKFLETVKENVADGCFIDFFDDKGELKPGFVSYIDSNQEIWLRKLQRIYLTDSTYVKELLSIIDSGKLKIPKYFPFSYLEKKLVKMKKVTLQ